MVARLMLAAAVLLSLSTQAQALCRDELKEVKTKIDHIKISSPQRYAIALKWWGNAMEAQAGSEVECLNYLTQAKRALTAPEPQVADCNGPNAYLPTCQNGAYGAVQPVTAFTDPLLGLNGGGGGGGAGPVQPIGQPTLPVTQGGGAPPTSTISNGNPEATGTKRAN